MLMSPYELPQSTPILTENIIIKLAAQLKIPVTELISAIDIVASNEEESLSRILINDTLPENFKS